MKKNLWNSDDDDIESFFSFDFLRNQKNFINCI